jgi:hypothetical protein
MTRGDGGGGWGGFVGEVRGGVHLFGGELVRSTPLTPAFGPQHPNHPCFWRLGPQHPYGPPKLESKKLD